MTDPMVAGFMFILFMVGFILVLLVGVLLSEGLRPWSGDEIDKSYSTRQAHSVWGDKD